MGAQDAWVLGTYVCTWRLRQIGTKNDNFANGNVAKCPRFVFGYSPLFALPNLFYLAKTCCLFPLFSFVALGRGERAGVVGPIHRLFTIGERSLGQSFVGTVFEGT